MKRGTQKAQKDKRHINAFLIYVPFVLLCLLCTLL